MYVFIFIQTFLLLIPNWRHLTGKRLEVREGHSRVFRAGGATSRVCCLHTGPCLHNTRF